MTTKALVVLSGGQDSTTCLYMAKAAGFDEVHAITFDYGQRHHREIEAAKTIAQFAGCTSHEVLHLGSILHGTSPLTDPSRPLEQYRDFKSMDKVIGDRVELTFVPMRNTLFLTLAMNRAVVMGASQVFTGVCEADNANYPDCRADFIRALYMAFSESLGRDAPTISTPLMYLSKEASILKALSLEGCYAALGYSHTAYDGSYPPTGHDHATTLRAHGFEQAGFPDPLVVRAHWEGLMNLPNSKNYTDWTHDIKACNLGHVSNRLIGLEALLRAGLHDH